MDNFGPQFTAMSAVAGEKKEPQKQQEFLTKKQWGAVIASAFVLAVVICYVLARLGM